MNNKLIYIKRKSKYIIGAAVLVTGLGRAAFGLDTDYNGYYQIKTKKDLIDFSQKVKKGEVGAKGKLLNDIVFKRDLEEWFSIGTEEKPFQGELISNNKYKTISGLYINKKYNNYQGLFGVIGTEGIVNGIKIDNSYITGKDYVGGIVGKNYGKIINCTTTGCNSMINGKVYVGGIVGYNKGIISGICKNIGIIEGEGSVGGNVGLNSGTISGICKNSGQITGHGYCVGGNVGANTGTISGNFINKGYIKGTQFLGVNIGINSRKINVNFFNTGTLIK